MYLQAIPTPSGSEDIFFPQLVESSFRRQVETNLKTNQTLDLTI